VIFLLEIIEMILVWVKFIN